MVQVEMTMVLISFSPLQNVAVYRVLIMLMIGLSPVLYVHNKSKQVNFNVNKTDICIIRIILDVKIH